MVKVTSPERCFLVSFRIRLVSLSGYMIYIIGICWTNGPYLALNQMNIETELRFPL